MDGEDGEKEDDETASESEMNVAVTA